MDVFKINWNQKMKDDMFVNSVLNSDVSYAEYPLMKEGFVYEETFNGGWIKNRKIAKDGWRLYAQTLPNYRNIRKEKMHAITFEHKGIQKTWLDETIPASDDLSTFQQQIIDLQNNTRVRNIQYSVENSTEHNSLLQNTRPFSLYNLRYVN